jgi:hypothetical protein
MACGACQQKAARRAAQRKLGVEKPDETGSWSVTFPSGKRTFHPTRLAALRANLEGGGQGMVRQVR